MHHNTSVEIGLQYCNTILSAVRTVAKGVVDIRQSKSWETFKIIAGPVIQYMAKGTDGLERLG
jgi:hypothetical protein